MHSRAFSLVELSIVLVILGLLTGGILAGQSLIRAAEIRSVIHDYQRYSTARQAFRDRYMALPGDMKNATRFWGDDSTACPDNTITDGSTCNGNGDGFVDEGNSVGPGNTTAEEFQFWKQLALAGLIEGRYSGIAGSQKGTDYVIGLNSPAGRIANTTWSGTYFNNSTGILPERFMLDFRNALTFGSDDDDSRADGPALTFQEIWSIDKKIDDGKPGQGMVICGWMARCTNATSNTDFAADYVLAGSTIKTWMHFMYR